MLNIHISNQFSPEDIEKLLVSMIWETEEQRKDVKCEWWLIGGQMPWCAGQSTMATPASGRNADCK